MNAQTLPMKLIAAFGFLIFISCNHSFTPKGPFEQQLIVYSLLSDDRGLQYVRVYASYDVQGFDPFQNKTDAQISGAQVIMMGPNGSYTFRDTVLPRSDTSHYNNPIHAYVSNFQLQPGATYKLDVTAGGTGSTSAAVTIPNKLVKLNIYPMFDLDNPDAETKRLLYVYVSGQSTPRTKGWAGQMLLQYSVLTPSGWQDMQYEVPGDGPGFSLTNRVIEKSDEYGSVWFQRSNVMYSQLIQAISASHQDTRLKFKSIVFRVLQVEKNTYDYYKIVHGFQDPYTIRFDQPDFTDLTEGLGLFGGCTIDTLVHDFPPTFGYNH
jgi:hypothetical protein